jgi:hypothetical protein
LRYRLIHTSERDLELTIELTHKIQVPQSLLIPLAEPRSVAVDLPGAHPKQLRKLRRAVVASVKHFQGGEPVRFGQTLPCPRAIEYALNVAADLHFLPPPRQPCLNIAS